MYNVNIYRNRFARYNLTNLKLNIAIIFINIFSSPCNICNVLNTLRLT